MKRLKKVVGSLAVLCGLAGGAPSAVANLACGLPPLAPIGCKVGLCVCDQNGKNCQWTFVCG